jgi:hypothetical protein
MKYSERCYECGSWELECGSDKPVKDCACVRCLSHTNQLLNKDFIDFLNMVQVSISHLLQDGDIDPEKETAITTLKNVLSETEELQKKYGRTSKWYNCAKCDALYEDQECTCVEHTKECGWHKDWHNCTCGAFNK